jgi:hypothetical protein
MLNIFSTKNAENFRYEISVLKNSNLSKNDLDEIIKVEKLINYSKLLCRTYCIMEFGYLLYFLKKTRGVESILSKKSNLILKMAFAYLRINLVWIIVNYSGNFYIENYTSTKRIINKHKIKNSSVQFKQFIEHKIFN